MNMQKKETGIAYLLWALSLVGLAGMHRFYIGKIGTGLLFLFTGGLLGLGTIYDAFTLSRQVNETNLLNGNTTVMVQERSNSNYE